MRHWPRPRARVLNYFFVVLVVVVIRHQTTAAAPRALLLVVGAFSMTPSPLQSGQVFRSTFRRVGGHALGLPALGFGSKLQPTPS
jgi:hypothetical protein